MTKEKNGKHERAYEKPKDKQLVSSQQHNLLDNNFGVVSKCLIENQMENIQFKDKHSYCYNLEKKTICNEFALLFPKSV